MYSVGQKSWSSVSGATHMWIINTHKPRAVYCTVQKGFHVISLSPKYAAPFDVQSLQIALQLYKKINTK